MNHLYRSRDDRMLAGVAGGLAELWDADPSLVRIVWALLVVLTGGIALVVYIVMAIVVPEEPDDVTFAPAAPVPPADGSPAPSGAGFAAPAPGATAPGTTPAGTSSPPPAWQSSRAYAREQRRAARAARRAERGTDGRTASIVIGGILILVGVVFLVRQYLPEIDWDYLWPIALVGIGVLVVLSALRSDRPNQPPSGDAS
ncbi:MAG TPA: PspC domain-containing protein [Candidatus Limnocylindrales bacterium]|jgi:phage shock protein C